MFERCVIHIGTEKTGTTSIQAALWNNADNLLKSNVLVPKIFGGRDNAHLVSYAHNDGQFGHGRKRLGIVSQPQLDAFRGDVQRKLREEAIRRDGSTLIVSSEHLHRLAPDAAVSRLLDLLGPYCRTFKIICFLRPQHELAVSLYSTALRVGHVDFPLLPDVKENDLYYNYDLLLDRWAGVFGKENITPLIYSSKDVLPNFLQHASLPAFDCVPKENTTLSGEAQAFLAEMNLLLDRQTRGDLANLVSGQGTSPSASPSRADAESFFSIFASSNEETRRKWFPHLPALFEPDFSKYPEQPFVPALRLEDAFKIFAFLWERKQHQINALNRLAEKAKPKSSPKSLPSIISSFSKTGRVGHKR